MHVVKNDSGKKRGSIILKLALVCLGVYFVFVLVSQQISIKEKLAEVQSLENQITRQSIVNEELQHYIDQELTGSAEFAEKVAREQGYAKPEERVFNNVGGN